MHRLARINNLPSLDSLTARSSVVRKRARHKPSPVPRTVLVVSGLFDQVVDDVMRLVDVMKSAVSKAPDGRVIFLPGDIIVRFIQQFLSTVEAAGAIHPSIDRRMIAETLAVVDRSSLYLIGRFVDLANGVLFFFVHVMGGGHVPEMSASVAEIGQGVQICRVPSWFVGKTHGGAYSKKKYEQGAVSCNFHGFLDAFRQDGFPDESTRNSDPDWLNSKDSSGKNDSYWSARAFVKTLNLRDLLDFHASCQEFLWAS